MEIKIDEGSGFCFGVVYAIERAEYELEKDKKLYCLGDIVHNGVEVERLENKGLITINHEQLKDLKNCKVLFRAHGEPAQTYKTALENNIIVIDASCPVVLKLQNSIAKGFEQMEKQNGQIVIYGKKGHAEVNGLVGQTQGKAIVVGGIEDLYKLNFSRPISIFSQTTKSIDGYQAVIQEIAKRIEKVNLSVEKNLITHDTICRQVAHRDKELRKFAKNYEIIVFVSGKKSSNGKMLYEICKSENENTIFISEVSEVGNINFDNVKSVGICGATSTPRWLMEKVASEIKKSK